MTNDKMRNKPADGMYDACYYHVQPSLKIMKSGTTFIKFNKISPGSKIHLYSGKNYRNAKFAITTDSGALLDDVPVVGETYKIDF